MKIKAIMIVSAVLLMCMLAFPAFAETQGDFEQGCSHKTLASATVYKLDNPDDGLVVGGKNNFTAIGSIPSGAYVRINSTLDADNMTLVTYWTGGSRSKGYISSGVITSATITVRFDDGSTTKVPEAYANNRTALIAYLNANNKNVRYSMIDGTDVIHVERNGASGADYVQAALKAAPDPDTCVFTYQGTTVNVINLGMVFSTVMIGKEATQVPTQDLTWTTSAPSKKQLALITAPKTGYASLRAKASNKGAIISKLTTGKAVAVIKVGKSYTRIWSDGVVGFVLTSTLSFRSNAMPKDLKEAVITFNGKTNSKNEINVRAAAKNGSRILGSYRAGTPVTVLKQDKTWTEIEVKGLHCYILSKYVTVTGDVEPVEVTIPDAKPAPEEPESEEPASEEPASDTPASDAPAAAVPTEAPDEEDDGVYVPVQTGTPLLVETEFGYDFDAEIDGDAIGD